MMKSVVLAVVVLLSTLNSNASDLKVVRESFYHASNNQAVCEGVYNQIKGKDYSKNPLLLGYQGVYQAIMAKYVWNPFTKWSYFQSGIKDLEVAISKDKENIELIFLRFAIQISTPTFLGYYDKIEEDKALIMSGINDKETRQKYDHFIVDIINYMLGTKQLSDQERANISEILVEMDREKNAS